MNPFIPPNAWLCREKDLNDFLKLFGGGGGEMGEVWLLNNDLALWKKSDRFQQLYCERVFGTYRSTVARLQIVLPDAVHQELFAQHNADLQTGTASAGLPPGAITRHEFVDRLQQVRKEHRADAHWLLQKLHFAKLSDLEIALAPEHRAILEWVARADQTWAFYIRGRLDNDIRLAPTHTRTIAVFPRRAAVLIRPLSFPFSDTSESGTNHYTVAGFRFDEDKEDEWSRRTGKLLDIFAASASWWPKVFRQLCMLRDVRYGGGRDAYGLIEPDDVAWVSPRRLRPPGPSVYVPGEACQFGVIVANRIEKDTVVEAFGVPGGEVREFEPLRYLFQCMNGSAVLFQCEQQGQVDAAIDCYELIQRFNPAAVCILGSCGGYATPGDPCSDESVHLGLGDVVVASHVFRYDPRKVHQKGATLRGHAVELWRNKPEFYQARPWTTAIDEKRAHIHLADDTAVDEIASILTKAQPEGRTDQMLRMTQRLVGGRTARVWLGHILSGSELIESPKRKKTLYNACREQLMGIRGAPILGFEMEIAGAVMAARRVSGDRPVIAIKGVMDDGTGQSRNIGSHKEALKKALQQLATKNSARVFSWIVSGKGHVCTRAECLKDEVE